MSKIAREEVSAQPRAASGLERGPDKFFCPPSQIASQFYRVDGNPPQFRQTSVGKVSGQRTPRNPPVNLNSEQKSLDGSQSIE